MSHLRRSETSQKLRSRIHLTHHYQGLHPERSWDNSIKTLLSIVILTCFGKDTFYLSYIINQWLPYSCLSSLCTLANSHDSRPYQTVFVAGLSLWWIGVNWMVTALPARRVVWCSVCTESRPEFFFPLSLSPLSVWWESDRFSQGLSKHRGWLSAHCHANSGTAWDRWDYVLPGRDVTGPGGFCGLQRDAWSVFSTISYHTDSDETIQGRNRGKESWTVTSPQPKMYSFFFHSILQPIDRTVLETLIAGFPLSLWQLIEGCCPSWQQSFIKKHWPVLMVNLTQLSKACSSNQM